MHWFETFWGIVVFLTPVGAVVEGSGPQGGGFSRGLYKSHRAEENLLDSISDLGVL
jgi:hypothetical protein